MTEAESDASLTAPSPGMPSSVLEFGAGITTPTSAVAGSDDDSLGPEVNPEFVNCLY